MQFAADAVTLFFSLILLSTGTDAVLENKSIWRTRTTSLKDTFLLVLTAVSGPLAIACAVLGLLFIHVDILHAVYSFVTGFEYIKDDHRIVLTALFGVAAAISFIINGDWRLKENWLSDVFDDTCIAAVSQYMELRYISVFPLPVRIVIVLILNVALIGVFLYVYSFFVATGAMEEK